MRKRWIRRAAGTTLLVLGVVGAIFLWPAGELVDRGCGSNPSGPAALVAVDADTGDLLWSSRAGRAFAIGGGPGVVAVGGDGGILRGFDGSTGEIVWCIERPIESEAGSRYAAAGPIIATLSRGGDVVAIEPSTGRERWRLPIDRPVANQKSPVPTVDFDSALQLIGGEVLWVTDGGAATSLIIGIDPIDGRRIDTPASLASGLRSGSTIEQSSGLRLQTANPITYEPGRQESDVALFDIKTDSEIWAARVPGFLSALAFTKAGDPMVVVIDQTGGTGVRSGSTDTTLSAYHPADGSLAWRRALPRTTLGVYRGEPGIVVTTSESELLAISTDDGVTLWSADHGSPGRQRPYTVDGRYRDIVYVSDLDAYVGLILAERPYRD